MRTKFRLFATLLMIALCAGFISCSSDNDEEKQADKTGSYVVSILDVSDKKLTIEDDGVPPLGDPRSRILNGYILSYYVCGV